MASRCPPGRTDGDVFAGTFRMRKDTVELENDAERATSRRPERSNCSQIAGAETRSTCRPRSRPRLTRYQPPLKRSMDALNRGRERVYAMASSRTTK